MSDRDAIVSFCEELLSSRTIADFWCENGLQIEGKENVKKIALGVSTTQEFLKAAAKWGADMCLVHHGLFWKNGVVKIQGVLKKRLEILLKSNMSLVNFHLPLDAHPAVGNNAIIIKTLGLKKLEAVECGFMAEL